MASNDANPQQELKNMNNLIARKDMIAQMLIQFNEMKTTNTGMNLTNFNESTDIIEELQNVLNEYGQLQAELIYDRNTWCRRQALTVNGFPFEEEDSLNQLQVRFEKCLTFLRTLNSIIQNHIELTPIVRQVEYAFAHLYCSAFVVVQQPFQVMQKCKYFDVMVYWLVGKELSLETMPKVKCTITTEKEARKFVKNPSFPYNQLPVQSCGPIENDTVELSRDKENNIIAHFSHVQLTKTKFNRLEKTGCVMEDKFAFFFHFTTCVDNYEVNVWTMSLPVVVITHTKSQEPQSWATIFWDNAFADIVREPFVVTHQVNWINLSLALKAKFGSETQGPHRLTQDNLNFLYEKLQLNNSSSDCISWNQFCKMELTGHNFTFWQWFYETIKLTKSSLRQMWQAGLIVGFISRKKAKEVLRNADIGTFLIRFSDSKLGGVSIAYVNQKGGVLNFAPWNATDLNVLSLAERIQDLTELQFLYSTDANVQPLTKESAFG